MDCALGTACVNIKITIEYDGTHYHGWQVQPNGETIQAVLERAISTFLRNPTRITGSGRTDAGVHALGQVANFFSEQEYGPHRIRRALNALTPYDITIKEVEIVADSFDARRDGQKPRLRVSYSQPYDAVAVPSESRLAYP